MTEHEQVMNGVEAGNVLTAAASLTATASRVSEGHPVIKDSGERRTWSTGCRRDTAGGKGRFDLLPFWALELVAKHFEAGARKYADRNWEKGMPLSVFADSALRHLAKAIRGQVDEPHWEAAAWNILCLLDGRVRIRLGLWPKELDDLPIAIPAEAQAILDGPK